jgi:hypothetical protein
MSEDEMSNKTEATFHPGAAPVYPVSPPVVAGPPGQGEPDPLVIEHWSAGEYPTSQLPIWAGMAADHGAPRETGPDFGVAGMHTWEPEPGERSWNRAGTVLGVILVLAIFLGALGFAIQRMNWLPAGVPLIGKDSGVAACQAIAKGQPPVHTSGIMTEADYQRMRAVFADSRYEDIRTNGTKLMDLAWQAQGMGQNNLGILALVGGIADAYSGLAGGCRTVGYTIPSLGS